MRALNSAGQVTLNVEGNQYAASYQLRLGVITVTSGSVSRVIRVGEAVAAPESLARTILRTMVRDNCQRAELKHQRPLDGCTQGVNGVAVSGLWLDRSDQIRGSLT
jgi:hypothetical protein